MRIEDWLFFETDDACAVCGQRGRENLTEHHIDHNPQNGAYDNLIVLCHNCHHRYHNEKGLAKGEISDRKRHLIHKTLTQYGLNALKITHRNGCGIFAAPFLLHHLVDLGYMVEAESLEEYTEQDRSMTLRSRFTITHEGEQLLLKWFL